MRTARRTRPSARPRAPSPEPAGRSVNEPRSGPVRTIFFGSGRFALPILDAVLAAPEVELVAVVSVPDRPVGRRGTLRPRRRSRLAPATSGSGCSSRRASATTRRSPRSPRSDPGSASWPTTVGSSRPRSSSCRPTGSSTSTRRSCRDTAGRARSRRRSWPATRETGVTLIRMDAGLDTGPIVAAVDWPLDGSETADELEARAADEGGRLVRRTLAGWLDGHDPGGAAGPGGRDPDPAAPPRGRPARPDPARDRARPAGAGVPAVARDVRGDDRSVRSRSSAPRRSRARPTAPTTSRRGRSRPAPTFGCGPATAILVLTEVQPGGGRPMTGAELVRGRPALPGSRLVDAHRRGDGADSR